jgi:cytochrome c oxidase assembly protein subunit 15
MVVLAVRARRERPRAWAWAAATLAWVLVQGLFGALTVTWKLYPAVVTGHLLGGIGLVALLAWQRALYRRSDADTARDSGRPSTASHRWEGDGRALLLAAVVLLVQIALGGWVSTNYAVLACRGFPACNGHWWPAMDWREGFTFLRELGHRADGQLLGFDALVAIHWTHRLFALVAVATLAALALRFRHRPAARPLAGLLAALLALQVGTGLSNVVLDWPLAGAVAHTAGAAALVVALCALATHLRDRDLRDAPTA